MFTKSARHSWIQRALQSPVIWTWCFSTSHPISLIWFLKDNLDLCATSRTPYNHCASSDVCRAIRHFINKHMQPINTEDTQKTKPEYKFAPCPSTEADIPTFAFFTSTGYTYISSLFQFKILPTKRITQFTVLHSLITNIRAIINFCNNQHDKLATERNTFQVCNPPPTRTTQFLTNTALKVAPLERTPSVSCRSVCEHQKSTSNDMKREQSHYNHTPSSWFYCTS